MDIKTIWDDYVKKTGYINSSDDAVDYVDQKFAFSREELDDLQEVCSEFIVDFFDVKKLKKKHAATYNSLFGLLMTMFFFGMHVAQNEYWNWPAKEE